jgi:hypothetical protein
MVLRVGALSDAELAAIASAEVPAQYAGLDAEFASPLCKPAARHVQRRAQQKRRKFHS